MKRERKCKENVTEKEEWRTKLKKGRKEKAVNCTKYECHLKSQLVLDQVTHSLLFPLFQDSILSFFLIPLFHLLHFSFYYSNKKERGRKGKEVAKKKKEKKKS